MERLPQVTHNVRWAQKEGWSGNAAIQAAIAQAEAGCSTGVGIAVRTSGTGSPDPGHAGKSDEAELATLVMGNLESSKNKKAKVATAANSMGKGDVHCQCKKSACGRDK